MTYPGINDPQKQSRKRGKIGKYSFTEKEVNKLLEKVDNLEDEILIRVAIGNGLRRLDISRLKVKNIDLDEKKITFWEHKKRRWKTQPISEGLKKYLTMYLKTLDSKQEYLFSFGKSKYGDKTAYNRLHALCQKAGVEPKPFHALRSTCVKRCQKAGWTIQQTAEYVGDTENVVKIHYTVPSEDEMRELVDEKPIL